jgi:hypothetical protein
MQVDRAKELATQYGKRLSDGTRVFELNLYDSDGTYIDSLHQKQILEMDEDAYVEFYLEDDY